MKTNKDGRVPMRYYPEYSPINVIPFYPDDENNKKVWQATTKMLQMFAENEFTINEIKYTMDCLNDRVMLSLVVNPNEFNSDNND